MWLIYTASMFLPSNRRIINACMYVCMYDDDDDDDDDERSVS